MNRWMVTVAALLMAAGCSKKDAGPKAGQSNDPLTVTVAAAEARKVEKSILVTGSLQPDETVTVTFEVPGRVSVIRYDFGQQVKKGAVVAELDKQEFQIAVDRTRASLAQALARIGLDATQENATPRTTPAIEQARAQFEDAKFRYESYSKLVKSGDVPQDRFVEIEKAYAARKAALDAAEHDLRTQLAAIQALRAEVRLAEKRLRDTTVYAPFDGAVSVRTAAPGQYLRDNAPVLTLVKASPLRLRAEIPESFAATVRVGTQLAFTTDAAPGQTFHAVVRELNPSLDARARSLTAEARIVEGDARLRPGAFAQVRLVTSDNVEIVAVPRAAVYSVAGLSKIFVIRDGKAVECKLPPSMEMDGWVQAPAGSIRAGEPVAVSNLQNLVNGAPVRVQGAGTKG